MQTSKVSETHKALASSVTWKAQSLLKARQKRMMSKTKCLSHAVNALLSKTDVILSKC